MTHVSNHGSLLVMLQNVAGLCFFARSLKKNERIDHWPQHPIRSRHGGWRTSPMSNQPTTNRYLWSACSRRWIGIASPLLMMQRYCSFHRGKKMQQKYMRHAVILWYTPYWKIIESLCTEENCTRSGKQLCLLGSGFFWVKHASCDVPTMCISEEDHLLRAKMALFSDKWPIRQPHSDNVIK